MPYPSSRKQSATLAALLGVSALAGWWAGDFSDSRGFPAAGRNAARVVAKPNGPKTMNATAKSAILAETTKLSGDEITAVQKELLAILKSGILEDGRRSNDSNDGVIVVRQAARAACLFSKLNQLEQDDVFGQLPESERGKAFKMIRMFSAMMADPKPSTAEKYAEKLAGGGEPMIRRGFCVIGKPRL